MGSQVRTLSGAPISQGFVEVPGASQSTASPFLAHRIRLGSVSQDRTMRVHDLARCLPCYPFAVRPCRNGLAVPARRSPTAQTQRYTAARAQGLSSAHSHPLSHAQGRLEDREAATAHGSARGGFTERRVRQRQHCRGIEAGTEEAPAEAGCSLGSLNLVGQCSRTGACIVARRGKAAMGIRRCPWDICRKMGPPKRKQDFVRRAEQAYRLSPAPAGASGASRRRSVPAPESSSPT